MTTLIKQLALSDASRFFVFIGTNCQCTLQLFHCMSFLVGASVPGMQSLVALDQVLTFQVLETQGTRILIMS